MYKALIRTPLQQAMLGLWLFGLFRLLGALAHAPPDLRWIATAALAAPMLVFIGARYRLLAVVPIAILLGVAAVVAAGHALGVAYPAQLGALVAVLGLALWRLVLHVQGWPRLGQLVHALGLGGGYAAPGGRWWAETYVYWSSLVLVLGGFTVDLVQAHDVVAVPEGSWPVLLAAAVFLLVSGYHYGRALNTYLFLVVACFAAFSLLLALRSALPGVTGATLPLDDLSLGLVLALVAAGAAAVASVCQRRSAGAACGADVVAEVYVWPLRRAGAGLALLALLQALAVAAVSLPAPAWMMAVNLIAAGAVLLFCNRRLLKPLLTGVAGLAATFGILWLASLAPGARPPVGMWPGGTAQATAWLILALLAAGLAAVGCWYESRPRWRASYGIPLLWVGALVYAWCLAGAVSLYPTGTALLPWIVAVLIAALFPLLRPLRDAVALRGIAVGLLLTLLVAAAIGFDGRGEWGNRLALLWGFLLWGMSTYGLPRLNPVLRQWGVAPQSWPWLGLAVLACAIGASYRPWELPWGLALCASLYLLLMLRHSRWPLFPWLGVLALTLAVVLLGIEYLFVGSSGGDIQAFGTLALQNLAWANALFGCIPLWRRHGAAISRILGWAEPPLRVPLLATGLTICVTWLFGLALWDGVLIALGWDIASGGAAAVVLGGVLWLSLFHAHAHGRANWARALTAHLLTAALVVTVISAWVVWQPFHLPLLVAIIGVLLAAGWSLTPSVESPVWRPLRTALGLWMRMAPVAGAASLLAMYQIPLLEQLASVALLAATAGFTGWRAQSRLWLLAALAFAALLAHGVWLLWVPWRNLSALLPFYAFQFALVGGAVRVLTPIRAAAGGTLRVWLGRPIVKQLLRDLSLAALALGTFEWLLHLLVFALRAVAGLPAASLGGWISEAAAIATGLILASVAVLQALRCSRERYLYLAVLVLGMTAVHARILWVGLAPLSVWDTGAIIAAAYGMFGLQSLIRTQAARKLNMTLPLVALATVPLQAHTTGATLSLFAIGALYLLTSRTSGRATPLYLGLLAINAGIYLWLPGWAEQFGLLQFYVIPAALTVLLLVHLHRAELRSHVVNGVRLAALSTLFGAAALDVFLQESLGVFVLALALSLAGIVVGVITRTRAFLYAGTAFLVINVLGQLLQLYPEQRLGRALSLMVLGAAITAAMIWFNLKREAILERLRLVRADLSTWD